MKLMKIHAGLALLALTPAFAAPDTKAPARRLLENYAHSRTLFEKNIGQAPGSIGFIAKGLGHAVSINASGATLRSSAHPQADLLQLVLLNANAAASSAGVDPVASQVDYYIGSDPQKWVTHVPVYQKVRYQDVWPGIDVVYYGNQSRLEYDLVVSPGADLNAIRFRFTGASSLRMNPAGDLLLETSEGVVEQRRPHLYQRLNGKLADVNGQYVIEDNGTVRFQVPNYDARQELVIDPILAYNKALDSLFNAISSAAVDSSGNAYFTGQGLGQTQNGIQQEAFLVRLDPLGNEVINITFGGSDKNPSVGQAVAVDPNGNIYITGSTSTTNFPLYFGFQTQLAGMSDGFLIKFTPNGPSQIVPAYSTYIGGTNNDQGNAVTADSAGNAYVTGQTASSNFPRTEGPAFHGGSATMAFAIKINTNNTGPSSEVWSTYLGGSGTDVATGVGVDGSGNVTVAGTTTSSNFQPASSNGYSPTKTNGSNLDGFVVVLDSGGIAPSYFTYWPYGPIASLYTNGVLAYATGNTNGNIFTLSPYQASGGPGHAFVLQLNTSITGTGPNSVAYATYLGGSVNDSGLGVAIDTSALIYVVGTTSSPNFPQTAGAVPLPPGDAPPDGFFTILDPATGPNGLVYSTLLGGNGNDSANGVAVTPFGDTLIAASSNSTNFLGGNNNGNVVFGVKFSGNATVSPENGTGQSQTFTFSFSDPTGYTDIAGSQIVINSSLTAVNSCYLLFARPDRISLASDSGGSYTTSSLGAPSVLQNSQCVVLASQTSQSGSGNTETLRLTVAFKAAFAGPKNVWVNYNTNAGVNSGWLLLGNYNATPPSAVISVGTVSPVNASGEAAAFTFNYFDAYGAPDISGSQIVFNSSLSGVNACYILFSGLNQVSLASDNAQTFTTAVLGQNTILHNSQCFVYTGNSYQTQLGQNLSVTLFIAFTPGFQGQKTIFASANNNANVNTGYSTLGTWTVPSSPAALAVLPVSPAAATGPSQAFTFVYEDASGSGDISSAAVIFNPVETNVNSCLIIFTPSSQTIALTNDAGNGSTTAVISQPTALENSQCIVNAAASTQFAAANYLVLTLFVTMKTTGTQNIYSGVTSSKQSVPGTLLGAWNVSSPATLTPVSVTPLTGETGVGAFQYFTFTMSDPAGASDFSGALIVLNGALQGANSCYILWGAAKGILSLASNNAQSFTSGTLGTSGLLSNSQCTVDPLLSFVTTTGDTANLTIAISFKQPYMGFTGGFYSFANVETKAAVLSGWLVESRFTVQ